MIEMAALLTLIERCAPTAPAKPLVAAVRQATGFEPLVLATRQNGRALTVQAMSRDDAIALASEMKIAGQPVRLGLAGIDAREFDRRDMPLGAAFDPCTNLRVAGELFANDPKSLAAMSTPTGSQPSPPEPGRKPAASSSVEALASSSGRAPNQPSARAWDVYGQARARAALVYDSIR